MSDFPLRKKSPTGNDTKRTTQGSTLRQQGFHEVNKRRAFLQDNSWIKKRPEEERDENYGRVVLNRHNSHDALDRKINERDEPKATISRYRSDDTLDRISDRDDAAKTYKANSLDNQLTNRTLSTFRSPEAIKTQSGSLAISNATTVTSASAKAPARKKRQSWFPPPPPGHNTTPSPGGSRRDPALHPPIPPKPTSPATSPHQLRQDNRQIHVSKPTVYAEASRSVERHLRSQDLDGIVRAATSLQNTDKGEEMDNIIQMNKSLNRNQGLDGLFRANLNAEQAEKRAQSLESLIYMNTQMDRGNKGNQSFGSLKKINQRSDTEKGKQDLHGLMKVNPEANKNMKRGQSLDNLTKVTPEINRNHRGSKDLNNLIKVSSTIREGVTRNQGLENLINMTPSVNKRNQDLDKFIKINPEVLANNQRNQDLDNVIKVNSAVVKGTRSSQDLDNLIKVKPPLSNTNRNQDTEKLIAVNNHVSSNNSGRLDGQVNGATDSLRKESPGTSVHFEASNNLSSNAGTRRVGPKDTVVYTRTYVENSRSPKNGYQENISGKYIQTVYSTSDRSVIERDMCTYCRKPLGAETKMILDELQICCHSTCFKCEICKRPLENLQAGDSIWIYRQTIHCEPCYSKVIAKWIQ